jgi:LuxR family transcriptional regulator, regulator of acetate metabolism
MPPTTVPSDPLLDAVDRCVARAAAARRVAQTVRGYAGETVCPDLEAARERLRTGLLEAPDRLDRLGLLARVDAERRAVDEQDARTLEETRGRLHAALARLRRSATSDELITRAPRELRHACGFTRVMISRAEGTRWIPDTLTAADGADPEAEEFRQFAEGDIEIPLAHLLLETEMVRHRVPVIVEDARRDPRTSKPLMRVTRSTSYVAAPITATRRVIGFLHADRLGQDRAVGPEDLECIALFADRFGLLLARKVLAERMEHQRASLHFALDAALDALDDLSQADIELDLAAAAPSGGSRAQDTSAPRRYALLTAREREVVQLVAAGATNRAIATELVVSVETVKSHMSRIMHKLGATSRAEAVARFIEHASAESGHREP